MYDMGKNEKRVLKNVSYLADHREMVFQESMQPWYAENSMCCYL